MASGDLENRLQDLREIRSMMEQATRFLSLSGLSGISAGTVAMAGTVAAFWHLGREGQAFTDPAARSFLVTDGVCVLILAASLSFLFSYRMARQRNLRFGGPAARQVVFHLAVPLISGGMMVLTLLAHGMMALVPGTTLLFYGLALLATSRYTVRDLLQLGLLIIGCGLAALALPEAALWIWGMGFGVLHIAYGILMYRKYER